MRHKVAVVVMVAAVVAGCGVGGKGVAGGPNARATGADPSIAPVVVDHPSPAATRPASPTPKPSASTTPSAWYPVGPRWFLASVMHKADSRGDTSSLDLISPDGVVHQVYAARSSIELIAWSGDGRRAAISVFANMNTSSYVVNLVTGVAARVTLTDEQQIVGFTRPEGLGLLVETWGRSGETLQRTTLTGADPVRLARDVTSIGSVVASADGQSWIVGARNDVEMVSNLGTGAARVVPSSQGCQPVRLWSATELLATCDLESPHGTLKVLPLAGGPTRVIARDPSESEINTDAYPASGQLYASTSPGCGPPWISRVAPDGSITPFGHTYGGPLTYVLLTSDYTDLAVLIQTSDCMGPKQVSLAWLNPVTQKTRTIFTTNQGGAMFFRFPTYNGVE